jgi:hypothetical protein
MVKVVGVHGIAQQYQSGPERTEQWFLAVRGGLEAGGFRGVADSLTASDLRVAFYGDLFRPPGTMAGESSQYTEAHFGYAEEELLAAFYDDAVVQQPELGPPPGAMGEGRPPPQVMLDRLLQSRTFAGMAKHLLIRDLKQVTAYLENHSIRRMVLDRLAAEVTSDARVLIGHSLGSVVAYEFCCQRRQAGVELLITLGSPLGIPRLVFDRLNPPPTGGVGAWPAQVLQWVNVADRKDVVALRKELGPQFDRGPGGAGITDRLVDNGDQSHDACRYLNSQQTGEAVGATLISAQPA